ncbi:uncharacterized protein LOC122263394 isoform X2 [Penaeus japonicus]|uniref:uncharacterized protein LOC122263394 isoform X2 n=1 Tax=Penaeus japonicus TaxID=27405 RepID=UPI001C713D1B|nr:uncharacterized protein LOC122263394 isoform X2 [Penaeus japonicus]
MSMNVGDSTDLIHGGGGGITVFWRSRTGFERKLLVLVAVLTLTVIGLIVAVAVLASEDANCNLLHNSEQATESTTFLTLPSAIMDNNKQDIPFDSTKTTEIAGV